MNPHGPTRFTVLPPLLYRYRSLTPDTIDREVDAILHQHLSKKQPPQLAAE
jgi:hypothetical protein